MLDLALLAHDLALQPPPAAELPAVEQPPLLPLGHAEPHSEAMPRAVSADVQPASAEQHDDRVAQGTASVGSAGFADSFKPLGAAAAEDPVQEPESHSGSLEPAAEPALAQDAPHMQQQQDGAAGLPGIEQAGTTGIAWASVGFGFAAVEALTPEAAPLADAHAPEPAAQTASASPAVEAGSLASSGAECSTGARPDMSCAEDSAGEAHDRHSAAALGSDTDQEDWDFGDFAAAADPSLPQEASDGVAAAAGDVGGLGGLVKEPAHADPWTDGWESGGISLPALEPGQAARPAELPCPLPGWEFTVEPAAPHPEEPPGWGPEEPWSAEQADAEPASAHQELPDVWGVLGGLDGPAEAHAAAPLHDPRHAHDPLDGAATPAADTAALPQLGSDWGGDRWQAWHLLMQVRAVGPMLDSYFQPSAAG